jgi:hypothetical protein
VSLVGCDNSSGGNTVLELSFQSLSPLFEKRTWYFELGALFAVSMAVN